MEEVGCWSTYYKDAYGHGESKMGFYHCHGGGRLLVDLLDAHVQGVIKMDASHNNRSAAGCPIIKIPMAMESPRWGSIIVMGEVGYWLTY